MENLTLPPNKLPLVLILIGTTLLAFPAAFGTIVLFEPSAAGIGAHDLPGQVLLSISVGGFLIFGGYILTAIFQRHSGIFWFVSMLYNFGSSCCYVYIFFSLMPVARANLYERLFNPFSFILPWTIFVTISSGYYFFFAVRAKKLNLS